MQEILFSLLNTSNVTSAYTKSEISTPCAPLLLHHGSAELSLTRSGLESLTLWISYLVDTTPRLTILIFTGLITLALWRKCRLRLMVMVHTLHWVYSTGAYHLSLTLLASLIIIFLFLDTMTQKPHSKKAWQHSGAAWTKSRSVWWSAQVNTRSRLWIRTVYGRSSYDCVDCICILNHFSFVHARLIRIPFHLALDLRHFMCAIYRLAPTDRAS